MRRPHNKNHALSTEKKQIPYLKEIFPKETAIIFPQGGVFFSLLTFKRATDHLHSAQHNNPVSDISD